MNSVVRRIRSILVTRRRWYLAGGHTIANGWSICRQRSPVSNVRTAFEGYSVENESNMLPEGDKTPSEWTLPRASTMERLKKPIRRVLYPPYLKLVQPILHRRYDPSGNLEVDQWYWGNRGLELEPLRAKLHRIYGIRGRAVLIAGCGTGREIPTWANYQPLRIVGVDYFNYQRAWETLTREHGNRTEISFTQADLSRLESIEDETFDVVGSDAVFEHLRDLPSVLKEFHRILKPGGVVYAAFGPLWYCWGGDHISGYDSLVSGYNHLNLESEAYQRYLDEAGEFSHSEHDGRTWIKHGLFSYFRPSEYLAALTAAGFEKVYIGAVLEPRALRLLKQKPEIKTELTKENSELDLTIAGMAIVYRKSYTSF